MKLLWNCNFNIPDSNVQVSEAYIIAEIIETGDDFTLVNLHLTDTNGTEIAVLPRKYMQVISTQPTLYNAVMLEFTDSVIV